MQSAASRLETAKRIVVKVGSSLLIDRRTGDVRRDWLKSLAADFKKLSNGERELLLVSSGAIALGWPRMGLKTRPGSLDDLQAAAAVGQIRLAEAYVEAFAGVGMEVAQLLISLPDFEDRRHYLNARATAEALIARDVVPVFNENDTVATHEIRFGDNDRLAARTAGLVHADLLVLLSDVDGLYTGDPSRTNEADHIPHISAITPEIMALAGPARSNGVGTGGMASKLEAARIATEGGSAMMIASGEGQNPLTEILNGARASLFETHDSPLAVRKRWLRGISAPKGFLHIDRGAMAAVIQGASLLAVGVTDVRGSFGRGDAVAIMGPDGETVALGLSSMTSDNARLVMGLKTPDAAARLGHAPRAALVHRDDLVIL